MPIRQAELVVRNAKVFTMDRARPWASALAVSDGRFAAVGGHDDVDGLIGPQTSVIDMGGKLVLPGLLDSHSHAFEGARADLFEVRLSPADDIPAIVQAIGETIGKKPGTDWLKGAGWAATLAHDLAQPAALAAIDEVTGARPLVLRDSSHHSLFANSAAMRAANVDRATPDVDGGSIIRRADGHPAGLFLESACGLIERAVPPDTAERRRSIARHAAAMYNHFGVTGFVQAAASESTIRAFSDLDRECDLNAWVATCIAMDTILTPEHEGIGPDVVARRHSYRSRHVAVDFVKFFMDGVPGTRTAAFIEPYLVSGDSVSPHPSPSYSVDELRDLVLPLDAEGIQVKIHAVGDRAIRDSLDAIAAVRRANGASGPRHSIAHLSYVADEDIERLAELNVAADLCPPLWFPNPILVANAKVLGDERGARAWPVGDIVRSGALTMIGTDWPIISSPNPWPGLAALITRQHPHGSVPGVFRPEQALSLEQMLPLCTINVAKCMGIDRETGSISKGKSADFIVLDRDFFVIDPRAIADTLVLQTFFAGRLVCES